MVDAPKPAEQSRGSHLDKPERAALCYAGVTAYCGDQEEIMTKIPVIKLYKNPFNSQSVCQHLYPIVARGGKIPDKLFGSEGGFRDGAEEFVATLCRFCTNGYMCGAVFEKASPPTKEGPPFNNMGSTENACPVKKNEKNEIVEEGMLIVGGGTPPKK
jgi:hypothetical protein